jgi:soluble epoxide hydrolase/lipid-phosphate phosphatase
MDAYEAHDLSLKNGEKTHYYEGGSKDGTPLIFIHGWPDLAETWKRQLSHFASQGTYRVIAPDMRGYGNSSAPQINANYSLEALVAEQVELAEQLGIKKAVWIGHDWGCGVVNALAAHHPELFLGLAVLSVPYRSIELGLNHLKTLINRDIYPEDEYEWGQFAYMKYYELESEKRQIFRRPRGNHHKSHVHEARPEQMEQAVSHRNTVEGRRMVWRPPRTDSERPTRVYHPR